MIEKKRVQKQMAISRDDIGISVYVIITDWGAE